MRSFANQTRFRFALVTLILMLGAGLPLANAQSQLPAPLFAEALDQQVDELVINDAPLTEALESIERETGLAFELDPAVLQLMPYAERTRVTIEIRDMSVRAGMEQVLESLGLNMLVADGAVLLVPAPVLERVGRRLTVREAAVLSALAAAPAAQLQTEAADLPPLSFELPPTEQPQQRLRTALDQVAARNALRALEAATNVLDWTWRPDGARVVIETRAAAVERRLAWPLDLEYQHVPLDELLVDLGSRVGVLVQFEPGALAAVSAADRPVDLVQRRVSARALLERICGNTGLRYELTQEGVLIRAPRSTSTGPTGATIQQWVRIGVEIRPGVKMDFFLRRDELPESWRETAEQKLADILDG